MKKNEEKDEKETRSEYSTKFEFSFDRARASSFSLFLSFPWGHLDKNPNYPRPLLSFLLLSFSPEVSGEPEDRRGRLERRGGVLLYMCDVHNNGILKRESRKFGVSSEKLHSFIIVTNIDSD